MNIDHIKKQLVRHEGMRLKPYHDNAVPPRLTIGVGRNLDDVGIFSDEVELMLTNDINRDQGTPPPTSKIPLPVGRWFKIRTHFIRSVEPTTIRVWFDDELALEWVGAINSVPTNVHTEYYVKLYAGVQHNSPWGKVVRYSRNVRIWR